MTATVKRWEGAGQAGYSFRCPGCNEIHSIRTEGPPGMAHWVFNGDTVRPVFTPSVLVTGTNFTEKGEADLEAWHAAGCPKLPDGHVFDSEPLVCHSFVGCNGAQPGEITFLSDCTHALAGQTVALPPRERP